ncbi:hypothetical protein EG328_001089 [Venturia inaequalis]|uniref:Uncharacterized protein n=1 Tax=Venturia inaequalis TaxID=5025 RepID=A0A8H3UFF0_VENIN|nr:hypothetical protein EG327_010761 [Venturia inaequalis]KAE9979057.1 hypothetical protein EG328_001089 [Venturia inaequalis]RDI87434.1 hypothetical protein Vi05172_g2366 [Venturia inaequalis]
MPYGRASLYDDEDELPESDDQLIMNVLNGLGIQERPDIDRGTSNCINNISSARSSYTAVDETSPKRCSVAFSEVSDGWTIAFRKSTDDRQKQTSTEKQETKEQVITLRREVQRLRAGVLTEREQERQQIKELKQKLQESQRIESRTASPLHDGPFNHPYTPPSKNDIDTFSLLTSIISEEGPASPSPSSPSALIAPCPAISRMRK